MVGEWSGKLVGLVCVRVLFFFFLPRATRAESCFAEQSNRRHHRLFYLSQGGDLGRQKDKSMESGKWKWKDASCAAQGVSVFSLCDMQQTEYHLGGGCKGGRGAWKMEGTGDGDEDEDEDRDGDGPDIDF